MAHSKESMLEDMHLKGGAIMVLLLEEEVQIKPDQLHVPEDGADFRAGFIRAGFKWINEVYENEYAKVTRIKKMQPDEMWARYKKWGGFEEHREVVLLRDALSVLRAKIVSRSRPDFYKKSKRDVKSNRIKAAASPAPATVEAGEGPA